MKLSVVSTNRLRAPDPLIPIGAATVAGRARALGHDVRILDLCDEADPAVAVTGHFEGWAPDVVAVSIRNLENNQLFGHHSFLADVRQVIGHIKAQSSAPVIAGGAGFSLFPLEAARTVGADGGFAGEVEDSLDSVLAWAAGTEGSRDILRPLGAFLATDSAAPSCEMSTSWAGPGAPLPAYDLLDCSRYVEEGAVLPVEAKRGCSLRCSFCPDGVAGASVRLKDPSVLVDEIKHLIALVGTDRLFFTDGIFQIPRPHAEGVCRELIRRDVGVRWSCGINPVGLDRGLLELMREAGCRIVALGLDAVTPAMLQRYRKDFGIEEIERSLADIRAADLRHTIHILFGGPGETEDSVSRALDELERLAPDDNVFLAVGLRVFKRTALEAEAVEEGVAGSEGAVLEPLPTYYLSPALGSDIVERIRARCRPHPGWHTVPF